MRIPMPAAVLAGGTSRRMGRSKAALPYGAGTLLEHQTRKLAEIFDEVLVVGKEPPAYPIGPARVLLDRVAEHAAIHGLVRALEETEDRVFLLGVDLPAVTPVLIREIARRGLETESLAMVPRADGRLQPLAAVWRRGALPVARERIERKEMSLHGLASAVGAEILEEEEWHRLDPSGVAFANLNTLEEFAAFRDRA